MVTGHFTGWTFHSSTRIALAWSHSAFTSASGRGLHSIRCSICRSRSAWDGIVSFRFDSFRSDPRSEAPDGSMVFGYRRIADGDRSSSSGAEGRVPKKGKTNRFGDGGVWFGSVFFLRSLLNHFIWFRALRLFVSVLFSFLFFLLCFAPCYFFFSIWCAQNTKTIDLKINKKYFFSFLCYLF